MIPITNTTPIKAINTAVTNSNSNTSKGQSSSSGFGFWSLNSTSLQSSTFSYSVRKKTPLPTPLSSTMTSRSTSTSSTSSTITVNPVKDPISPVATVETEELPMKQQQQQQLTELKKTKKEKKKVSFQSQCQVRTFEVLALDEEFEATCQDDEEYWEQLGEDFWYQAHDFQAFKKERRSIVDRIRTIGLKNAKGNYVMEGLEFFLTLQAREVHKERVLDGWVSVLEVQADWEQDSDHSDSHSDDNIIENDSDQDDEEGDCSQDDKVELIACKYAHVSRDCIRDAHKRGIETAQEIQAEDEKLVASIPKSPRPKKASVVVQHQTDTATTKVKALGVWGNTWSTMSNSSSSSSNKNTSNGNGFGTFQKIRPFPRQ